MQLLLATLLVTALVVAVLWPLVRGVDESSRDPLREELEIAKQAKYREIKDAEIDYCSGKLTEEEWRNTDRELRREAIAILARIDAGRPAPAGDPLD